MGGPSQHRGLIQREVASVLKEEGEGEREQSILWLLFIEGLGDNFGIGRDRERKTAAQESLGMLPSGCGGLLSLA